jgi:hypothetical protein
VPELQHLVQGYFVIVNPPFPRVAPCPTARRPGLSEPRLLRLLATAPRPNFRPLDAAFASDAQSELA